MGVASGGTGAVKWFWKGRTQPLSFSEAGAGQTSGGTLRRAEARRNGAGFSSCEVIISTEAAVQTLVEGQSIRHEQYGMGVVTESNTERTTIDFDDHGVKKFVTAIWSAELVGEPPATPPTKRRGRRKSVKKA